ncbi:MAG: hypothetical protein AB7O46_02465 [Xanthobacteraceae bacterium]
MKQNDNRGAAKGLTLDNLEDMIGSLRHASAPTRNSKRRRDAARLKKSREARAKQKLKEPARAADK